MSTKTTKIIYWVLLALFCLFHVMDAAGGLSKAQAGIDAMHELGYPVYLMTMLAILKLLGIAGLLQNKFTRLKEWAFAGFSFTLIGAAVSRVATNGPVVFIIMPLVFLAILFVIYYLWRKLETAPAV